MTSKAKTSKPALTEIAPANVRHAKNLIQDARKDPHAQHARHAKPAAASGTDKDVLHKQANKQQAIKKPGQLAGFLAFKSFGFRVNCLKCKYLCHSAQSSQIFINQAINTKTEGLLVLGRVFFLSLQKHKPLWQNTVQ